MAEHPGEQTVSVVWYAALFGLFYAVLRSAWIAGSTLLNFESHPAVLVGIIAFSALVVSQIFSFRQGRRPVSSEVWGLTLWSFGALFVIFAVETSVGYLWSGKTVLTFSFESTPGLLLLLGISTYLFGVMRLIHLPMLVLI